MKNLNEYRKEIDRLDDQIVKLLNRRAQAAVGIGKIKSKTGKPVLDQKREAEIIARLKKINANLPEKGLEAIYREIISSIRSMEKPITVAYLGPEGTFTHEAALKKFGVSCIYKPKKGWEAVFKTVEKGEADYGVLPLENSIEGSVNLSLDLLTESPLTIYGEKIIAAHQNLLSKSGKIGSIKKLYSHPQPLGQCRRFIEKNLPNVTIVTASSTAAAAQKASKTKNSAALASMTAAKKYGLKILKSRVEDFPNNYTRFMVISYQKEKKTGNDRTSIVLTIKNRHGQLLRVLKIFEKRRINLTRIVSRPMPRSTWGHLFYIDFEGHTEDKRVESLLKEVAQKTVQLKVLGSYPISK